MNRFYRRRGKRLFDLFLSIPAIILLSPVMLITAVVVRWYLGEPILFRQRRPGHNGRPFTLYKFRSMRDTQDAQGRPLPDDERLTRLGHLLRTTSLDELPELINVVRGDMSLVGPRPLLMRYLNRYTDTQMRRHEVRPGITGWAQINGRNAIGWNKKFDLDVWYVDHLSFWLDLKILALTVWKTLKREGISGAGHATAHEFMGDGS